MQLQRSFGATVANECVLPMLQGGTPTEHVLVTTPDISAYGMFDRYEPVWYNEPIFESSYVCDSALPMTATVLT